MKRNISAVAVALQLAACTTLAPLPHDRNTFQPALLRAGDTVVLTTTNRVEKHLDVVSITPEEICGKEECVRAIDVDEVRRRQFSVGRTVFAVLGAVLVRAIH